MTAKALFTEPQAQLIWDTIKLLRTSGLLRNVSRLARPDDPGPYPVFVKNVSGEAIPPFACMQVDGTEDVDEITYVKVDKPSSTDGQYLFNGESEIEEDGFGMSFPWGVVKMLTDGTITAGGIYSPTVDAWTIEVAAGGPFVVYGADNTGDDVARGRFLGGGGGSRLVRFAMTGDWSGNVADADFQEMDGTAIGADTLRDPEGIFAALGDGDRGLAMLQGGKYWAVQAACPAPPEEEEED